MLSLLFPTALAKCSAKNSNFRTSVTPFATSLSSAPTISISQAPGILLMLKVMWTSTEAAMHLPRILSIPILWEKVAQD